MGWTKTGTLPAAVVTDGDVAGRVSGGALTGAALAAKIAAGITGKANASDLISEGALRAAGDAGKVDKSHLWFDVTDYGAVGDGVTDDTAAIQAAIDACIGGTPAAGASTVRSAKGIVYLPKSPTLVAYRITAPLKIYSVLGLVITGGATETFLYADGVGLSSVLDMNGLCASLIRNLTITAIGQVVGTTTVTTPVRLDWDPAVAARSTSNTLLENITVRNLKCVNGFGLGVNSPNFDVSSVTVRNCRATGLWAAGETTWYQAGFHFGNGVAGNVLDHWAYNLSPTAWRRAIHADAVNLTINGLSTGFNEVDVYGNGPQAISIKGVRSEHSGKLYAELGGASYGKNVSIETVEFVGTAEVTSDGRFIDKQYTGSLTLENVRFTPASTSVVPMIYCGAVQTRFTSVFGIGVSLPVANVANAVQAPASATAPVRICLINYSEININDQVVSSSPFYVKTLNGAPSPAVLADGVSTPILAGPVLVIDALTGAPGVGAKALTWDGNAAYVKADISDRVQLATQTNATVADAVTTNASTTLTSATAAFVAGDVGRPISGAGIQNGTTIASRTNATTVELSLPATATATGVTIKWGRLGAEVVHMEFKNKHIETLGSNPTIVAGAGAGTSPTVAVAGTDSSGTISVTTGTSPAIGLLATITGALAFTHTSRVMIVPSNAAAALIGAWGNRSSQTVFTVSAAIAPPASTLLTFNYWVVGAA